MISNNIYNNLLRESKNIHYLNRYIKFINFYKSLDNFNEYAEIHHILPKSMFPEFAENKENLIKLPYRAHYLAHWLLAKATQNFKMISAFNAMSNKNKGKLKSNSILYSKGKKLFSEAQRGKGNPNYGYISAWNKILNVKVRVTREDFYSNQDVYGGITCREAIDWKIENEGYIRHSQPESQKEIARKSSMNNAPARCTISGISLGRISKDDPRWKSGEIISACKGKKKIIKNKHKYEMVSCPHCNFVGSGGGMTRYHFNNCKYYSVLSFEPHLAPTNLLQASDTPKAAR